MLLFRTGRGTLNAYIGIRRKHITRTRPLSASEARQFRRASEADKGAIKRKTLSYGIFRTCRSFFCSFIETADSVEHTKNALRRLRKNF